MFCDAFDRGICRIGGRGEDKKDLVIAIIKLGQCNEIAFEPRLHTLAGTEHCRTWRVEAGITLHPAPHISYPAQTVPYQVHAHGYLEDRQVVEKSFHVSLSVAEPFVSRWTA